MRKQVMTLAWSLVKATNNTISDLSTALRAAWKAIKAKAAIRAGGAVVTFRKVSGETVNRFAMPFTGTVKDTGRSNPLTVLYTCGEKGRTSSFRADRLISFTAL